MVKEETITEYHIDKPTLFEWIKKYCDPRGKTLSVEGINLEIKTRTTGKTPHIKYSKTKSIIIIRDDLLKLLKKHVKIERGADVVEIILIKGEDREWPKLRGWGRSEPRKPVGTRCWTESWEEITSMKLIVWGGT